MIKNKKIFVLWLILVVSWNFAVPEAEPIYDVIVAIVLSFFSSFLNNKL
tara:strand:+ start:36 stop:182 length:147 start_codon:yes stop_codon:yes gene_type:complete